MALPLLAVRPQREPKGGDVRKQSGFTLVEMLVVVMVLGILAAIAIPQYLQVKKRAYVASVTSDLEQLSQLLQAVAIENAGSFASLDGTDETAPALLATGYHGSAHTHVAIAGDAAAYCVEGTDDRSADLLLVLASDQPGVRESAAGCG